MLINFRVLVADYDEADGSFFLKLKLTAQRSPRITQAEPTLSVTTFLQGISLLLQSRNENYIIPITNMTLVLRDQSNGEEKIWSQQVFTLKSLSGFDIIFWPLSPELYQDTALDYDAFVEKNSEILKPFPHELKIHSIPQSVDANEFLDDLDKIPPPEATIIHFSKTEIVKNYWNKANIARRREIISQIQNNMWPKGDMRPYDELVSMIQETTLNARQDGCCVMC